VFESGWFWGLLLFLLPAGVTASVAWRSGRERHDGSTWARVISTSLLAISMLLCVAIAVGQLREKDPEFLPTAVGITALAGANVWLLMVRPRWAVISLACSALLLPLAALVVAPLFVVDPHEVPPGPNPETTFGYAVVVAFLYSLPALIASAFATKA
jgi:hypothetical protein